MPERLATTLAVGLVVLGMVLVLALVLFPRELYGNLLGLLLLQPLVLLTLGVSGLRSRIALGSRFPLRQLIEANGIALGLSAFLPAKAGELVKPWVLGRTARIPTSRGVSMVVIERTLDGIIVLLLAALVAFTAIGSAIELPAGVLLFGLIVVAAGLLTVGLFSVNARRFLRDVLRSTIQTMSKVRNVIGLVLSSIAVWALSLAMMIVFGLSSGHEELSVQALVTIFVGTSIGLAVGITPGGWGIVEGIMVGLLLLYGLSFGDAITFAVTFRVAVVALPVGLSFRPLRTIIRQRLVNSDG